MVTVALWTDAKLFSQGYSPKPYTLCNVYPSPTWCLCRGGLEELQSDCRAPNADLYFDTGTCEISYHWRNSLPSGQGALLHPERRAWAWDLPQRYQAKQHFSEQRWWALSSLMRGLLKPVVAALVDWPYYVRSTVKGQGITTVEVSQFEWLQELPLAPPWPNLSAEGCVAVTPDLHLLWLWLQVLAPWPTLELLRK